MCIRDRSERLIPAPDSKGEDVVIPFDSSKRFNIVVFDEGCVEADAGHQKNFEIGSYDATGYMEELFKKTSRETNWLSAGKLILMAERYAGCLLYTSTEYSASMGRCTGR